MGKKFISILGTNDYQETIYNLGDFTFKTSYIQEFLTRYFCKDWDKEDKVIIFLTEDARKLNWNNELISTRRLKTKLESLKDEGYGFTILDKDIPEGKNEEEIWQIFRCIFDEIEEGDEVIFDITHGFRSLPMLALTVLNYAKVVKDIKILGIYYGAFELNKNRDSEFIVPVFDLTNFDSILEWSYAVNAFLKYGNAKHISDVANISLREKLIQRDPDAIAVRNFANSLNNFTSAILTCRGKFIEGFGAEKSIYSAYQNMKNNLMDVKDRCSKGPLQMLLPLFDKIEKRTKNFDSRDNLHIGIATVGWCIENDLIEQAYTALDEAAITYVCQRFGLDETNSIHREEIVAKALNIKALNRPRDTWKIDKEYEEKIAELVDKIDKDFADFYQSIKGIRNDLNHFGYTDNVKKISDFKREIKNLYDNFKKIISDK
ncbi:MULTISPECIES: TIGR02221 family CRISPR-associated protein [Caloramator]|uniref:CRISPR-associated protein TM1812 n=1 Tax=Caloramator australicus RC3 TaxID=857293 RepID=I7KTJ6_9CLOT|nr:MULTISPECIES: TIGR02221 family CRISPR-associated protein [Caloramator]MDO6354877.1 TIGR02221 family CRISPR-associated protein [Caloramator sp. CAR-1]CCJ33113.1 CRISPR-associated protein TM1812 [Caloramator australicus RC3]